jgi:tetratricopeptide (TPR) repeat protein
MSKATSSISISPHADRFMQTLRQTLEHVNEADWLEKRSPLASVLFAGAARLTSRHRQIGHTGRKEVDERLRTAWHRWEERTKSPLQSLLWEAVCRLPYDPETHSQALLLLTYFEDPRPKQSEVFRLLALGRSTYYRYLDQAVEQLGEMIVQLLRPALRLEQPVPSPLIGRAGTISQALQTLRTGRTVHLVGGSGLGKTSLGAQLAVQWPGGRPFWYTFRPGVTDHLDQLLFALAYFLHQQGASDLWLLLTTNPQDLDTTKAMTVLRHNLAQLPSPPPLFCFDEVDLLLADDLQEPEAHSQIRAFLDDLIRSPRNGAPVLLIGQKLLFEPEPDALFTLTPFTAAEVAAFLHAVPIRLAAAQQEDLLTLTRGNPLLLRLFVALHKSGTPLNEILTRLNAPVTLAWFVARLRQHLAPADLALLYELSVFESSAPRTAWRTSQRSIRTLIELGLAEVIGADRLALHPALRATLYQQLPPERKNDLHRAAAVVCTEHGLFTQAAAHYVQGGSPELALWTWYTRRQQEISQGQAGAALAIFAPLAQAPLPALEDQRALALLLAELWGPAGRAQEGLAALAHASWAPHQPSTARAHELRGELLADLGDTEHALAEYRRSLEDVTQLRATQEIRLHTAIGRRALVYLRDHTQARSEVAQARFNLEVLQGEIEDAAGNYTAAHAHYTAALALAGPDTDRHQLAKVHEVFGILEARHAQLTAAVEHLEASGRHYAAIGNLVCSVGVTNTNLSYAYLFVRRYAEALPPAQTALAFFSELNHPYWLALNEANLAEAYFYLGEVEKAEEYAQRGLQREEEGVRPYCLYVLGLVRRAQGRFGEAVQFGQAAIAAGEELQDPWALGPAWRALGESYHAARQAEEAQRALGEALRIFRQLGVEPEVELLETLATGWQEDC